MHNIGSHNFSDGTSSQDMRMAPGSPGEQGVSMSSTITFWSFIDGPLTYQLINVLEKTLIMLFLPF